MDSGSTRRSINTLKMGGWWVIPSYWIEIDGAYAVFNGPGDRTGRRRPETNLLGRFDSPALASLQNTGATSLRSRSIAEA